MSLIDRIEAAEREREREQRELASPPHAEIDLVWKLVLVVACAAVVWWLAP